MSRFILYRLAAARPHPVGVLLVTFLLLYVAPGDPVQAMVGERADPETLARLRAELRLDDPLPQQFGHYVGGVLRGDLGTSYITRRPILRDLLERFPATLRLAGAAMLFAATGGHQRRHLWRLAPGQLGRSARHVRRLPRRLVPGVLGRPDPDSGVRREPALAAAVRIRRAGLPDSPALTLGMRSVAFLSRMTRAAMQEVLRSDFVRTARAKGLLERRVVLSHGFRNALLPVVTVLGLDFGSYLTGSILTETIFSWPGVGRYVLTAIDKRDLPAIQGSILFLSLVFVMVNLLTDLLYARVDPRVAYD